MDGDSSQVENESTTADDSIWNSPNQSANETPHVARSSSDKQQSADARPTYEQLEAREQDLRRELEQVRKVNQAIEGVIDSLGKAKNNMKTVNNTVHAASALLNTWTRILSQTEHNQRLILDPNWHGASQDMAEIEQETQEKQRAAERREVEDQERKSAAAKRAEEEERRKAELVAKQSKVTTRGSSSRIGTAGRKAAASASTSASAASSTNTSYVQMGGSDSRRGTSSNIIAGGGTRRTTSGIGRGGMGRGTRGRGGTT